MQPEHESTSQLRQQAANHPSRDRIVALQAPRMRPMQTADSREGPRRATFGRDRKLLDCFIEQPHLRLLRSPSVGAAHRSAPVSRSRLASRASTHSRDSVCRLGRRRRACIGSACKDQNNGSKHPPRTCSFRYRCNTREIPWYRFRPQTPQRHRPCRAIWSRNYLDVFFPAAARYSNSRPLWSCLSARTRSSMREVLGD